MSKYYKSSDYYPDDKDIFDFVKATAAPKEALLDFLQCSGVFVSPKDRREEICEYLSTLNLSWPLAVKLIDCIDLPEPEEYWATEVHQIKAVTTDDLVTVLEQIKDLRGDREREVYVINSFPSQVQCEVTYLDLDAGKTRILQRRLKTLKIVADLQQTGAVEFRFSDIDRAHQITMNVVGKLIELKAEKPENVVKGTISLRAIRDPAKRIKFFLKLMNGVGTFASKSATGIKVERLAQKVSQEEDDESEEDTVVRLQDSVRKIFLQGDNLLVTPEYQELVKKGFFIAHAQWLAEDGSGNGEQTEFAAGFNDPEHCSQFAYKILGRYYLDENGKLKTKREKLHTSVREALARDLQQAAFNARAEIEKE